MEGKSPASGWDRVCPGCGSSPSAHKHSPEKPSADHPLSPWDGPGEMGSRTSLGAGTHAPVGRRPGPPIATSAFSQPQACDSHPHPGPSPSQLCHTGWTGFPRLPVPLQEEVFSQRLPGSSGGHREQGLGTEAVWREQCWGWSGRGSLASALSPGALDPPLQILTTPPRGLLAAMCLQDCGCSFTPCLCVGVWGHLKCLDTPPHKCSFGENGSPLPRTL